MDSVCFAEMSQIFCPGLSTLDTQCILSPLFRSRQENSFPAPTLKKPKISLYTYRNIFNREFNLSFGLPQTDTCARCEALDMALLSCGGEDEMNRLLEECREHQEKGGNGCESKRRDKQRTQQSWKGKTRTLGENSTSKDAIDMITFDFQQNLPPPHLHHNDIFHLRQLWTYNFGIHDCINEQGYMFLLSETTAKRGSSEFASCLHKFFTEFKSGARLVVCCCKLFNKKNR
ncbi:uncharacterized protein LOC110058122 [Orbicella faveolata]|uniref:uncharacterized protein LOC110058122 n=1 Tax=Orbicella faveolata TaxID=48498 RepID=UPI0009E5C310|nr:uncharacterized protein LOC110058122 [Orbicella faveolata]